MNPLTTSIFEVYLEQALNKPAPWYARFLFSTPKVPTPSMILAQQMVPKLMQTGTATPFKGLSVRSNKEYKVINNKYATVYTKWNLKTKTGELVLAFNDKESKVLSDAKLYGENFLAQKKLLDKEAARQQKALDIICGTYLKRTTAELLEKSLKNMRDISSANWGAASTTGTLLSTGGTTYLPKFRGMSIKTEQDYEDLLTALR